MSIDEPKVPPTFVDITDRYNKAYEMALKEFQQMNSKRRWKKEEYYIKAHWSAEGMKVYADGTGTPRLHYYRQNPDYDWDKVRCVKIGWDCMAEFLEYIHMFLTPTVPEIYIGDPKEEIPKRVPDGRIRLD